nr:hypothetical protein BaRGS_010841 [Batillaria attramentaria]
MLFNSGRGSFKDDFLSLEIIGGRPKLSVNSGSGVVEVVLAAEVNDGKWHQLDLTISQSSVELRIDNTRNTTRVGGDQSYINLAGHLYRIREIAVRFRIVLPPRFGRLEVDRGRRQSESFTLLDLLTGKVNYVHDGTDSSTDDITIEMSGALYYSKDTNIMNPLDFDALRPLETGSNFSQADINAGHIYFKFHKPAFERLEDYLDLTAKYPSSAGKMLRVWFEYSPQDTAISYTNYGLQDVAEGGQKVIEKSALYLEMAGAQEFQFSMIHPPQHGSVSIINPRTYAVVQPAVEEFTTADIREGRLMYQHDDSENSQDSFSFTAVPVFDNEASVPEEIQELSGTFHITVAMRNDNPPERIVDKVFHVVTNGRRKLTLADLAFTDKDAHFNVSSLQYRRQSIPNGEILRVGTDTPVYEFTQKDLEDETLVFQHSGAGLGRAAIFVSDGQFYWTGLFEIQASDPYIAVENNTGLLVYRGGQSLITSTNLSLESNLDQPAANFNFIMTEEPRYGQLRLNTEEVAEYTYADVLNGRLSYWHDGSDSMEDKFKFAVVHGDIQTQGTFPVMIEDRSMRHSPEIVHNQRLKVTEGKAVTISRSQLLVQHPALRAEDVELIVTSPPSHGAIRRLGLSVWADSVTLLTSKHLHTQDPDTDSKNVIIKVSTPTNGHLAFLNNTFHRIAQFTQNDIDAGRVVFVHKVFPNTIHPVSNASLLAATTSANFSKPIVFTLVDPKPRKGKVVTMVAGRPLEIKSFTQEEVNLGQVFYQHTAYMQHWRQTDSIHLEISTAYASPLHGEVCDIHISYSNINSENQAMLLGLYKVAVSEGGSALITRTHFDSTELLQRLRSFQEDVTMTFEIVTPPEHGKLFLDDSEIKASTALTQDDIDSDRLKYQHDDSDTTQDQFVFSVDIQHGEEGTEASESPRHLLNFTIESSR